MASGKEMCVQEWFYGTCHEDKQSFRNGVLVMCVRRNLDPFKGIASYPAFSQQNSSGDNILKQKYKNKLHSFPFE